jgi:SET domain-containing protein
MKKASSKNKQGVSPYPKTVVKKSFAGKGIFALEDIKKGEKILQYIGVRITTKYAEENPNRYIFEIDKKWSIDGSPNFNKARYFNHSCAPNAESIMESGDRIFIAAKRKIKAGEEITFNYGPDYLKDYIKKGGCRCSRCMRVS